MIIVVKLLAAIETAITFIRGSRCPMCGRRKRSVELRRRNTAYSNDAENFHTCCEECHDDSCQFWSEMWQEYYDTIRF